MGTNISQHQHSHIIKSNIFHFGNIEILTDKSQHIQYFEQTYNFIIGPEIQKSIQNLKIRNNLCPYLIHMKNIQLQRSSACSNQSKLRVSFEYIPYTLQKLIQKNHKFSEKQVIRLLVCLLQAVKYLNSNDSYHGDISPDFIYIDYKSSQEPTYRIFDSAYFQPIRNGYYRAQKQKIYCAPEILMNLGQKRLYPIYNHFVADTFSIGLVVLYCMTLVNPLGAYNLKNQIDSYFLQSMFRIAHRKMYHQNLITILRECLQFRNRPSAAQILQNYQFFLSGYQYSNTEQTIVKTSLKRSRLQFSHKIYHS